MRLEPVSCYSSNHRIARFSVQKPSAYGTRLHGRVGSSIVSPPCSSWLHFWRRVAITGGLNLVIWLLLTLQRRYTAIRTIRPFTERRASSDLSSRVKTYQDSIVGTRQGQAFKHAGGVVALTTCCYMAHLRNSGSTSAAQALVGRSLARRISLPMRDVPSGGPQWSELG